MTAKDAGEEGHDRPGLRGRRFDALDGAAWQAVLRDAFDYRGDVTLGLDDGSRVAGYLFSHEPDAREPHVKLLPPLAGAARVVVPIGRIRTLEFTGDDKADGRSWAAWVKRWEEKRRLLAQGVDAGDIEPRVEVLD